MSSVLLSEASCSRIVSPDGEKILVSFKYDSKLILTGIQSVFTHAASVFANSWEQKKAFNERPQDLFGTPKWPPFHCSGTAIGLEKQNNNFARASNAFVRFFLPSLHDYDVNVPNFTFWGGREHQTTTFFFFSWTSIQYHFYFILFFSTALLGTPLVIYNINLYSVIQHKKKKKKKRKEGKTQKGRCNGTNVRII